MLSFEIPRPGDQTNCNAGCVVCPSYTVLDISDRSSHCKEQRCVSHSHLPLIPCYSPLISDLSAWYCCLSTRAENRTLTRIVIFIFKLLLNSVVLHITHFQSYCFHLSPSAVTSESCTFQTGPCVTAELVAAPHEHTIHHQPRSKNINKGRAFPPIQHPPLSHGALTFEFSVSLLATRAHGAVSPNIFLAEPCCCSQQLSQGPPAPGQRRSPARAALQ